MSRTGARLLTLVDAPSGAGSMQAEIARLQAEVDRRFGQFVLDRVDPGYRERDRHRLPLSSELLTEPAGRELVRFALPREVGGEGRDKFEWGILVERLAYLARDHGFSVLLNIYADVAELFVSSSAPGVVERYVPRLASGELTATQASFESRDPWDWTTTARRTDRGWLVNGTKRLFAAATVADLIVTYVREEETGDLLAFVVERDDPGVCLTGLETPGLRSMGFGQMMLTDVLLDEDERLMWRADALSELNTYARNGRLMVAASFVGMTEAMFDLGVERLATRFRGGRPLVDYPNVERTIGEMRVAVETAKSMLYRGLDATRGPRDPYFDELATAAKHYAFDATLKVDEHLMNLFGGEGFMRGHPWELFARDLMGGFAGQGAHELLLIQLGQRVVHTSEMRRVQEEAADRQLGRLSDAWVVAAVAGSGDETAPARDVLAAAGEAPEREAARALVETSAAIVEEARAGRVTERLAELEDRAASVGDGLGRRCASFTALAAALESGVLDDLLLGRTVEEIADRLGVSEDHVTTLLGHLEEANLVRDAGEAPALASGLGWLRTGGPRRSRFEHEIRTTLALAHELDGGRPEAHGREVGLLCDHFLERILPELVGLEERLSVPGARILVASDELSAELGRRLPCAALSDRADPGGDAFVLAWLDDAVPELDAAAPLLADGAWVVAPAARGDDELSEAVQRFRSILRTGHDVRGQDLEALFVEQELAGVATLPGPPGARTDLVVGRKVTRGAPPPAGSRD